MSEPLTPEEIFKRDLAVIYEERHWPFAVYSQVCDLFDRYREDAARTPSQPDLREALAISLAQVGIVESDREEQYRLDYATTDRLLAELRKRRIAIVPTNGEALRAAREWLTDAETEVPAGRTFEDWHGRPERLLRNLLAALAAPEEPRE